MLASPRARSFSPKMAITLAPRLAAYFSGLSNLRLDSG